MSKEIQELRDMVVALRDNYCNATLDSGSTKKEKLLSGKVAKALYWEISGALRVLGLHELTNLNDYRIEEKKRVSKRAR